MFPTLALGGYFPNICKQCLEEIRLLSQNLSELPGFYGLLQNIGYRRNTRKKRPQASRVPIDMGI